MADANTDRLGLIQMEEGSHSNDWGDIQNVNTGRIDAAARGFLEIVVTGSHKHWMPRILQPAVPHRKMKHFSTGLSLPEHRVLQLR